MKFSYVGYEIEATATIPSGEFHRSRISVCIISPRRWLQIFGLLDTGADHVFVSTSLAELLGIKASGNVEMESGAGGHEIDVWPRLVEIEVSQGGDSLLVGAGWISCRRRESSVDLLGARRVFGVLQGINLTMANARSN